MAKIPPFRHRPLHGLGRRLGVTLRRALLGRFVRTKRARIAVLNGRPYKRLTLPDSWVASQIAENLRRFAPHGIFPPLVAVLDRELLLEFVEGEPIRADAGASVVDRLARFFAVVHAEAPRRERLVDSGFHAALRADLGFLRDVGVLEEGAWKDLEAAADALAPDEVWIGYDYLDPLPRNFVMTPEGRLVAVDVEELLPNQLLGGGVAKAVLRWLEPHRTALLRALARESSLDLTPAMPYAELCFLARWTARAYLKGRHKLVQPARFEPYRSAARRAQAARGADQDGSLSST